MQSNVLLFARPYLRVSVLITLAALASACSTKVDGSPPAPNAGAGSSASCVTTRQVFAREVWPKVIAKKCINCHAPGGLAAERHASLRLYPPAYPGFLDQNLASLRELAKTEYEEVSVLIRKPLGELSHGGGAQLEASSEDHGLLVDLVERLQRDEDCAQAAAAEPVSEVELLAPGATFRKASLLLAGRAPKSEELVELAGGDAALAPALDRLMTEPAFKDWLLVTFNDLLLTDRYLGDSTNTLRREDFPNVEVYLAETVPEEEKRKYRRSVAREPLELVAFIVQNNRPFTEILTADYTVLNPYSALIYNDASVAFANPEDENELRVGKIAAVRAGETLPFPHAGVLSSPMFLNRFPTSPTNRNRHRAKVIFEKFLATDILRIGDRPIDPTASVAFANPTREDASCSVCHSILDPVAGAFMKFSDTDAEQLVPNREWYKEMVLPGFAEEPMQVSDYPASLPWLSARIAADPRFALSVVYNAFTALTSQRPLEYPADAEPGALRAWEAQDAVFRAIAAKFVAAAYDYKTVIRELILTPYFRAASIPEAAAAAHAGELGPYATARLSTPESLTRKLRALVGFDWARNDRQPALTTTYDILYGGIDSEAVTQRLLEPNGVMSSVMSRMANEVSCQATAWDFLKPREERTLFPAVDIADTPLTAPERIRANLRHLHGHLLGEELPEGSPELERTFRLFQETWQEGTTRLAAEQTPKSLPWNCRGRWNRLTGEELPEGQRLEEDASYTLRAWMAVVTYLLLDYRFLYE